MNRRDFLKALGAGTVALTVQSRIRAGQPSNKSKTRFSEGVL
ncbi:MAG: twin-arginine translocation signal domain-containing protein, partial [Anaerohalosphaera sp.]|nr:twin-arginine translocation signal domain-containing protein [Anaerohalosphaera sp.]